MYNPPMRSCDNPKCRAVYPTKWHSEGKACKVGRRCFCKPECAKEYSQVLRDGFREQD